MNWFDWTIIVGAIVSTLAGIYWGFIRQSIIIVGLFVAIWLAANFGQQVSGLIFFTDDPAGKQIGAFLLILLGVSIAGGIIASIIQTVAGLLLLGLFDHISGAVLGFIQYLVLMAAIIIGGSIYRVPWLSDGIAQSALAGWVSTPLGWIAGIFPQDLQQLWEQFRPR